MAPARGAQVHGLSLTGDLDRTLQLPTLNRFTDSTCQQRSLDVRISGDFDIDPTGRALYVPALYADTTLAEPAAHTFDSATGEPTGVEVQHKDAINACVFSADDTMFATASQDGSARVWRVSDGTPLTRWLKHGGGDVFDGRSGLGPGDAVLLRAGPAR